MGVGGRDDPLGLDLAHTAVAQTGEKGVLLQVRQRVFDCGMVGRLDLLGDPARRDRPQRGHRLRRRKRQIDRRQSRSRRPQIPGDPPRQLGVGLRRPLVLRGEHPQRDLGADALEHLLRHLRIAWIALLDVPGLDRDCALAPEIRPLPVSVERPPQPGQLTNHPRLRHAVSLQPCGDCRGIRMPTLTEQRGHLLLGDGVPGLDPVERDQPRPDPPTRRLALRLVVIRQCGAAAVVAIGHSNAAGVVQIPVARCQLVQRHDHTIQGTQTLSSNECMRFARILLNGVVSRRISSYRGIVAGDG